MHLYLAESPFFDHSSKNGLHFLHAQSPMGGAAIELMKDRRRFEEDLRRHVGVEYLIVGEPQEVDVAGKGKDSGRESSGVYVFRKQDRQRRRGEDGRVEEEVTTLGTYYCVGDAMYQAPSVGDIVGNKLLSATTHLSKFFETAKGLPSFDPTKGYSYLPQHHQPTTAVAGTSAQASPSRSREGSVLPTTSANATAGAVDSQSLRSTSIAPAESQISNPSSTFANAQNTRLLASSFRQALEFADEFADENPLIGEPGHFAFTSSLAAVSARKRKAAEEEAKELAAKASKAAQAQGVVKVEEKENVGGIEPPAVMSSAQVGKERRGSKFVGEGGKKKRSKSKAHLGSIVGVGEGAGPGT